MTPSLSRKLCSILYKSLDKRMIFAGHTIPTGRKKIKSLDVTLTECLKNRISVSRCMFAACLYSKRETEKA